MSTEVETAGEEFRRRFGVVPEEISPELFEPEVESSTLAFNLLPTEKELHRRVLRRLLGKPRRYSDLTALLQGKQENNLTVALKTLQRAGLISRETDGSVSPPVHFYGITSLGIEVVLKVASVQESHAACGDAFNRLTQQISSLVAALERRVKHLEALDQAHALQAAFPSSNIELLDCTLDSRERDAVAGSEAILERSSYGHRGGYSYRIMTSGVQGIRTPDFVFQAPPDRPKTQREHFPVADSYVRITEYNPKRDFGQQPVNRKKGGRR